MAEYPGITAGELARRLGGELAGDAERVVRTVTPLEQAGPDAVSWVGSEAYVKRATTSKAGVLIVPEGCALDTTHTIVRVADPDVAMCDVLAWLAPPPDRMAEGVHPTAVVSPDAVVDGVSVGAHAYVGPGAVIGPGTQLYPGVYIGARVRIGRDCTLWSNVVVREGSTIGDRVVLHSNATIGADGFGYLQRGGRHVKIPQIGGVVIEDDVEIGANSAVDRARSGVTRVGRGTKIDNLVQVGHNVEIGEQCIIVACCALGGSAILEDGVLLAGAAGVSDHVRIGKGAFVAAYSCVMSNVPAGMTVRGSPATEHQRFLRAEASLRKLPRWIERLRDLIKRVDKLEERASGERR